MKRSTMSFVVLTCVSLAGSQAFAQNPPKAGEAPPEAGHEQAKPPEAPPRPAMRKEAPPEQGRPEPMKPRQGEQGAAQPEPRPPAQGQPGQRPPAPPANAAQQRPAPRPGAPARSAPRLDARQQTHVTEVIRNVNVHPVHVDFNVNVGVAVPRTVALVPLPPEIISFVPEYSGFEFFEVPGEIIIVDPVSLEIVAVLPL